MIMFRSGLRHVIDQLRLVTSWSRKCISTSKFQMSLKSLICMESYYFQVYVVSCDVHFRYSDDALCGQRKTSPKYVNEAVRS